MAAKAIRTISGAIWSCSRIMNIAITMTIAGTTVATTLPVGVSPMHLGDAGSDAGAAMRAATTKIRIAAMTFGR